jgi:hypothetical protein
MNTLWYSASRNDAAKILCGDAVNILMHDGPHGFGLYLQATPEPMLTEDPRVILEFELSGDVDLSYHGIGWEPAAGLPFPNVEVSINDGIINGAETVCIYNAAMVRLISILCC